MNREMEIKIYVSTDDKHIKQIVLDHNDMMALEWALKFAEAAAHLSEVNARSKKLKEIWKDARKRIGYIRETVIVKGW